MAENSYPTEGVGFENVRLDLKGLAYVFLSTWPFIKPDLKHFLALLAIVAFMVFFGLATAFLSFEILMDSVGQAQPLAEFQAAIMLLETSGYVQVERLGEAERYTVLVRFLIVTIFLVMFGTSMRTAQEMYQDWILQRVNHRLRVVMVANAESLSLRNDNAGAGDAIYRVFQDSAMVTAVVENIVVAPLVALFWLVGAVAVASLFSGWIAFLIALAFVVCFVTLGVSTRRLRARSVAARSGMATVVSRVQDTFRSLQVIKAYNFAATNSDLFAVESEDALARAFELRRDVAIIKAVVSFVLAVVLFATDYLATQFVIDDAPVFGASALIFFGIATRVWTLAAYQARRANVESVRIHVDSLVRLWCLAQDMAMGLGRAFWLLNLEPEVTDPDDPETFPDSIESIEMRSVTFGYVRESPVVAGVDLALRRGTITAIVGESGAGKSTLMSLLLRLYDPDSGALEVNGRDFRRFRVQDLRSHTAVALQENVLFPTTIRDNIGYAAGRELTGQDIEDAAQIACAEDFIAELPEGYDTELGADGGKLSTGQRQRISVARALVRDAPILILDEPTASIDAETERRMVQNLKAWSAGRIVVIVTHRLSTVTDVDQIALLKEGALVEVGNHAELLAADGAYAALVRAGTDG